MTSSVSRQQSGPKLKMAIVGRFDFSILQDFRDAYSQDIEQPIQEVDIDLSRAEHMDSSGMGLLLSMKKELQLDVGTVHLVHCRPHVKEALLAARLDHFFKVN